MRWILLGVVSACALACNAPCRRESCPTVDQSVESGDYRVAIAAGTLVQVSIDHVSGVEVASGGEIVLAVEPAPCAQAPCRVALKRMHLGIESFPIETSAGTVEVQNLDLSLKGPVELVDGGDSSPIPKGTAIESCMAVDGENDHGSLPLTSDLALSASAANQTLSVVGALPFTVRIDKDGCQELKGSVSGLFAGSSPWVQADQ